MTSQPAIDIESLSFDYPDGTAALAEVSLHVAPGEKVALAGGNGAGKSTLVLHLAGVLGMDSRHRGGHVRVAGLPVDREHLRLVRQKLGLVFQNPDDQLFCPTIFEDVAFGPRNLGLDEGEVQQRVEQALAAVGLAGFARRSSMHLSLGEKKRAAIATVLSMRPEILALDEPTSMLDPRGCKEIAALLASLGGTQIIVTHDLAMIARLCDRMVVLDHGRKVADGPPGPILADEALLARHGLA